MQNSILQPVLEAAVQKAAQNNDPSDQPEGVVKKDKFGFPVYTVPWTKMEKHYKRYGTTKREVARELLPCVIKTEEELEKEGRLEALEGLRNVQSKTNDRRVMIAAREAILCSTEPYGEKL